MTVLQIFFALAAVGAAPGRDVDAGSAPPDGTPGTRAPAQPLARPLVAAPPANDPGGSPPDEYQLRRAPGGNGDLIYEAPGFTASVARDGSVSFHPRHLNKVNLIPALPGGPPIGVPTLQGTLRGLGRKRGKAAEAPRDPIADETRNPSTAISRYRPDPREICQYPRPCFFEDPVMLVGAHARLDLTDELTRFAGEDPYRYQKAHFLAATQEMRVRMAGRAHAEDLAQSRVELAARLRSIACDDRLRPSERRAIIQQLRAELDVASPEGHAQAAEIDRFLAELDRHDGGARCSVR
jgi:hypothetical protein